MMNPQGNVTIRAADDWLVFGQDENGDWFYVSTELWPEWTTAPKCPEEMEAEEAYAYMLKFAKCRQAKCRQIPPTRPLYWLPIADSAGLEELAAKFKKCECGDINPHFGYSEEFDRTTRSAEKARYASAQASVQARQAKQAAKVARFFAAISISASFLAIALSGATLYKVLTGG